MKVYGDSTDIAIAQSILGNTGYVYTPTDLPGFKLPAFCSNNIIVGGNGATGGIGDVSLGQAIRLAGANRDLTAQAIANYVTPINVYGAGADIQNAQDVLGNTGYNYVHTDATGFVLPSFCANDIILGGTGATGGIGANVNLNGAIRLAGVDRTATAAAIRNYAVSKKVYGDSTDITIAKGILENLGYVYIPTDLPGFKLPIFCTNNIIVGGTGATGGIGANVNLNGAIRLAGVDRAGTTAAINAYAGVVVKPISMPTGSMQVSDSLVSFTANYEGFRQYPYRGLDSENLTVGYGHVIQPGEDFSNGITKPAALALLKIEMNNNYAESIKKWSSANNTNITQTQFDSLSDFAYNAGPAALPSSTLGRQVVSGTATSQQIRDSFCMWVVVTTANGSRINSAGLYRRRMDEADYILMVLI